MAHDLLARLWKLPDKAPVLARLREQDIRIKRVIAPDRGRVLQFVEERFGAGWMHECEAALSTVPSTCYIAVKDKQVIGFACFEATAKDYFGPIGVDEAFRGGDVGTGLLLSCLHSMWEMGYAYAVIGWADGAAAFYEKTVGATVIPDSHPAAYQNLISK
ncbi:MAG: GNAT family N-acetyltransferase [Clostridia bacterium]|nr:GNAT family N-acetyltransferase [Clostridia bacterium]